MRSVLLDETGYYDQLVALNAFTEVARVDLDRTRAVEAAPSDTSYADQWSLPRVGWDQLYGTVGIAGASTVAVLDTGVDASHPDLDGVVLPGTSVLDGSNGLSDPNGHGTWMAGIVAAETDNAFGIAGTAYAGVSVLPVTVLGADGTGQDSDIIAGVVYAADAGADVILMSFSNPGYSPALQAAIDYAWASGAVLVAATGNDGSSTATFPAGDRGVIGVTSTDSVDALAAGANYGPAAFMAAPGVDIPTTSAGGSVAAISGTSAAAAQVAGAAALLQANEPALSNGVIVSRLARNADPTLSAGTGNGRLNLARAMADASTDSIQPAGAAPVGDGGPLVGPYVAAAVNGTLEGQSCQLSAGVCTGTGTGTWITGNLQNWRELDLIPYRLAVTRSAGANSRTFTISFDHTKTPGGSVIPGIENLTAFAATGSGVSITSGPTLTVSSGDVWEYQLTVQMTGAVGSTGAITFNARLSAGANRNTGSSLTVSADNGAGNVQISKPAAQPGIVDLSLTKTGPADTTPGQVITYTLNYSNLAGASTATGVQITDTLPTGSVDYVPASCSGSCTIVGNTITWTIGSLAAGASGSRTYQVTAKASLSSGNTFVNGAQINSAHADSNFSNNSSSVTTTVRVPSISGTVLNDLNGNLLDDDGGAAISGATVVLLRSLTGTPGGTVNSLDATDVQVGTVTTNAAGAWTFGGLTLSRIYFAVRSNPSGYTSTRPSLEVDRTRRT